MIKKLMSLSIVTASLTYLVEDCNNDEITGNIF